MRYLYDSICLIHVCLYVLNILTFFFEIVEEDGITGSLCPLPLSVHGSASAQMQMINITKNEKQVKYIHLKHK